MKAAEMTGKTFGFLTVLGRAGSARSFATWHVRCVCGVEKVLVGNDLRMGGTKSCGCKTTQMTSEKNRRHGMTHSLTWNSWLSMRHRCGNPNDPSWDRYGGRGIRICKRWDESFEAFLEDMGERPVGTTIDRIDNAGHYKPGNCRWATHSEQQRNTRVNHILTLNGRSMTVAEWVVETGLKKSAIFERLRRGWSDEDTLTKPLKINRWH